jgi:exodeoxyribonuclease VII large subunit
MNQPAFELRDDTVPDDTVPADTLSVRELAAAINGVLRGGFGDGVWVRGEIKGWSGARQHAYFQLVDDTPGDPASIDVAFFAGQRARLRPLLERHRLELADGIKVRIFGRLDFYAPSGKLSLKMSDVDPRYTLGELALERDLLVQRLVAAGLFDANRRHPFPVAPLRVGLVTSVGSAAWHDATTELQHSGLGFRVKVVDVRVQGEGAPEMIAAAVTALGSRSDLDVVMVVRGGGSRTDLAAFDTEPVALAIARCPLPVVTGIGHETDRSVADEVASRAYKTPTACAAGLVGVVRDYVAASENAWLAVLQRSGMMLDLHDAHVATVTHQVHDRTVAAVTRSDQRLAEQRRRLTAQAQRVIAQHEQRLTAASAGLGRAARRRVEQSALHLDHLATRVHLLDPARTLARGWSITRGPDGRVVHDAATLRPGDRLTTTFSSGTATSRVEEVNDPA